MPNADIQQIVLQSGPVAATVCLMLLWGHKVVRELLADQTAQQARHEERIDKLIADHRNETARIVDTYMVETSEIMDKFRGDLSRISSDTTSAINALADEVRSLTNRIEGTDARPR